MIEWVNAQELAADHVKAPPSQPVAKDERAGCKAWCGMEYADASVPNRDGKGDKESGVYCDDLSETAWCSPLCRDAKYPPLPAPSPARPAVEVAMCSYPIGSDWIPCALDDGHAGCHAPAPSQPAETVKSCEHAGECRSTKCEPAKPATAGKCEISRGPHGGELLRRHVLGSAGAVMGCDMCMRVAEERFANYRDCGGYEKTNVLRSKDIPERITAPKLASDWYDDCLPEAGR